MRGYIEGQLASNTSRILGLVKIELAEFTVDGKGFCHNSCNPYHPERENSQTFVVVGLCIMNLHRCRRFMPL